MRQIAARTLVLFGLLFGLASTHLPPAPASAQAVDLHCDTVPLGALPPARPIWCLESLATGPGTSTQGTNSWLDEWDHGLVNADIGPGYQVFEQAGGSSLAKTLHWRSNNHWMVDVAGTDEDGEPPYDLGGAMLRPDRSFRFENGKLIVEADVAAGIQEYANDIWPELVITTAPAPTFSRPAALYVYDEFANHWTLGCRLESDRGPTCALFDDSAEGALTPARVFEISFFQHEGATSVYGGEPGDPGSPLDLAWRKCEGTDPDTNCRDRFRWEISKDTFTIYVNGVKYMEHAGMPVEKQLPDAFFTSDIYVYYGSWTFKPGQVSRMHWDRLAVNPATGPTAAPGWSGSPPTPTPTPVITPTPTPTPAPGQQTVTFDDLAGENQPLDGAYPSGLADWGSGQWWHSGPFGAFTTKSVSFNGGSLSSATVTLASGKRLVGLTAHNGAGSAATVTLSCSGQPTVQQSVLAGQTVTIATGWASACAAVTIESTNGWDTNFDDLVVG